MRCLIQAYHIDTSLCTFTILLAHLLWGNFVHVANPGLVGQTKHWFCFSTSERAMSTTAHHFVITLKPRRQKATSASCHFNVLSVFFLCAFAPHFSEASSPLPTAIGYESAAGLGLQHVTCNETGKFHPRRSDRWLLRWNPLPATKRRGQGRQW